MEVLGSVYTILFSYENGMEMFWFALPSTLNRVLIWHQMKNLVHSRDVPTGGCGQCRAPQYLQICEKVGQKAAMLEEIWPQYFLGPFVFSNNSG